MLIVKNSGINIIHSPNLFSKISQIMYCQNSCEAADILQFSSIQSPFPGLIKTS